MRPVAQIHCIGEVMDLLPDGRIGRASFPPSAQWVCTGAVRLNPRGEIVHRFTLAEVIRGDIAWRGADGTQLVHLSDRDHGTDRVWLGSSHEVRPVRGGRAPFAADGPESRGS
jgi:hypothetical protein